MLLLTETEASIPIPGLSPVKKIERIQIYTLNKTSPYKGKKALMRRLEPDFNSRFGRDRSHWVEQYKIYKMVRNNIRNYTSTQTTVQCIQS